MSRLLLSLTLCGFFNFVTPQLFKNSTNSSFPNSATVHWLGETPTYNFGTTFGLPWAEGQHYPADTSFTITAGSHEKVDLQTWVTGYWLDGSIKWTGHAIPASEKLARKYTITAQNGKKSTALRSAQESSSLKVSECASSVTVDTGNITVVFPKSGNVLVSSITTKSGKTIGENGHLVLQSQSGVAANSEDRANSSISYFNFLSNVDNVTVTQDASVRALVTVRGTHQVQDGGKHADWLPFVLRFYLYKGSNSIRLVHSLVFDGAANEDLITGLGIRFSVPLKDELPYDRHVRFAGVDGGLLSESVQGITGLRRDPGQAIRTAQVDGKKLPATDTWDKRVPPRLRWIPKWGDYSLSQLSSDGFTIKKRTKAGQSWVSVLGGTRAGGLAYLGGATKGGLAVGLRDFWKRFPSGLSISNAVSDSGELTLWLYDPASQPLDLRPYHDGLGQDGYKDQLDALEITYEDWEPGFDTPYGIARTSEVYIFGFEETPTRDTLAGLTEYINNPPVLAAEPSHLQKSKAIGTYWNVPDTNSPQAATIESHLDFLFKFYEGQIEQRRWYGFLDYGDFMHTYDNDRHSWRYDVGGYGWDNSELSPDLFFWLYFLRTGRHDVYRFAEALTRHTGEVDVYHIGKWKGLGTRHGVQHFSDSAKQARVSQPQYRKYFYYFSGGDERVGELMDELLDTVNTYGILDPNRKVRTDGFVPTPGSTVAIGLGTDYGSLAGGWLIAWERRGSRWEEARTKLTNTITGIAALKNGFVTGTSLFNLTSSTLGPPPSDPTNNGSVSVSHLSAVFGLPEVISELIEYYGTTLPAGFKSAWLDYCYYFHAPAAEQIARYGVSFGTLNLYQGHSRLLAYAAREEGNATIAKRAWSEFYKTDGLLESMPWNVTGVGRKTHRVVMDVTEIPWMYGTNDVAQYGLAAIQNLAMVRGSLEEVQP